MTASHAPTGPPDVEPAALPVSAAVVSDVVVVLGSTGVVVEAPVVVVEVPPVALVVTGPALVSLDVGVVVDVPEVLLVLVAPEVPVVDEPADEPPPGPQAARRTRQVVQRTERMAGTMAAPAGPVKR